MIPILLSALFVLPGIGIVLASISVGRPCRAGPRRRLAMATTTRRVPATPRPFQAFCECPDTRCRMHTFHLIGEPEIYTEDVQMAPHFLIPAGTYLPRECQHCGWTWREWQGELR